MTQSGNTEPILDILMGLQRRKGFLGLKVEAFSLIVTPRRLVFAAVSSGLMKEIVMQARSEAKSEGAGFMGQWGAQLAWMGILEQRYRDMSVEAILEQFSGSFSLLNSDIRRVSTSTEEDDDGGSDTHEVSIQAATGKHRFQLARGTADEAREILGQTLGSVLK